MIAATNKTITGMFLVITMTMFMAYYPMQTNAEYEVINNHFVHDHFYPNRCGVEGYNCCNDKEECQGNNTEGACVQHRTTDGHCYPRKCSVPCKNGYV